MFKAIEDKALELFLSLQRKLTELREDDRGVVSAEAIAVTAVFVLIAITVIYAAFSSALSSAISTIGSELNSWVSDAFEGAPDPTPPPPAP